MSRQPPWTNRGQDDVRRDVRNRSATIHPTQTGRIRLLTQPFAAASPADALLQFKRDAAAHVGEEASRDEANMHEEAPVASKTESVSDSEVSQPASSQLSGREDKDAEAQTLVPDFLHDLNKADSAELPASNSSPTTLHPHEVWRK